MASPAGWGLSSMLVASLIEQEPTEGYGPPIEGHFDDEGRAWWLSPKHLPKPLLRPSRSAAESSILPVACELGFEARQSSDKRSFVGFTNTHLGVNPPEWLKALRPENEGTEVWVKAPGQSGQCE